MAGFGVCKQHHTHIRKRRTNGRKRKNHPRQHILHADTGSFGGRGGHAGAGSHYVFQNRGDKHRNRRSNTGPTYEKIESGRTAIFQLVSIESFPVSGLRPRPSP